MQINMQAPINALSYGVVSQNLVSELCKLKHDISLFPISNRVNGDEIQNKGNIVYIQTALSNAQRFSKNAPSIRLFHAFSLAEQIGQPKIGFPIFELDQFNDLEKTHLNNCDLLIVASEWAKSIINDQIPAVKCEVVGLGIDPSIFSPSYNKSKEGSPTIFLNIAKYEVRKGHYELAQMFNDAFSVDDNVELWMVPHNYFISAEQTQEWTNLFKNSKLGNKIKIIPRLTNQAEVVKVINDSDCGIFPSRAEGWGLPENEILACGKHLITTNYSAHTEFCNKDNSMLIEIDELEESYDGVFFTSGIGRWAAIEERQIEQGIEYMREVHRKKQNGELGVNEEGIKTGQQFTWANAATKLVKVLETL